MEMFNASCPARNILLFHLAKYGRMNVGRCMKSNYGQQGCSIDVTNFMNHKCAGRDFCLFQVPDPDLYKTHPCPSDFTSYLESSETKCPWVIEALPGQRINLTMHSVLQQLYKKFEQQNKQNWSRPKSSYSLNKQLYQYGADDSSSSNAILHTTTNNKACFEIGFVVDGAEGKRSITVCQNDATRDHHLMLTNFHIIRIEFTDVHMLRELGIFILEFNVVGCPTLRASANSWQQKTGDSLIVRCNSTSQKWHLVCRGNEWSGEVGNCSAGYSDSFNSWSLGQMFNAEDSFPFGVLLAVSIGVAMGIVIGGFLLCLITLYLKRQRQNNPFSGGYSSPKEQQIQPRFQMTRLNAMNSESQPLHNNWLVLDSRDCVNNSINNDNNNNNIRPATYQSSCMSSKVSRKAFQSPPIVLGLDDSFLDVANVIETENMMLADQQKIYHHDHPCLNNIHNSPQRYYSLKALSDMPKVNNADLLNFKEPPTLYETSCFS
ncbi:hypothetical protein HELRODRAFT_190717 [Helobdella robusta]|uniref:SUEL-type lectin domain-containing protein n=1 Tax=Helobdella robusta TaxID=6412 RepID=T1FS83_HELRO|nr:hypothetical protein HELRODRAFT_190717 [Helobdella robusta]ESO09095.1 hypothetical protein HELRODRAFT_190717 [Helobdella robusta]